MSTTVLVTRLSRAAIIPEPYFNPEPSQRGSDAVFPLIWIHLNPYLEQLLTAHYREQLSSRGDRSTALASWLRDSTQWRAEERRQRAADLVAERAQLWGRD